MNIVVTYTNVLAIDEELRNIDFVRLHPFSDFLLVHMAHEHVPLLELHHECLEDFLHSLAFGVGGSDDAHAGEVQNDFSAVFLFVVLRKKKTKSKINSRLVKAVLVIFWHVCGLISNADVVFN